MHDNSYVQLYLIKYIVRAQVSNKDVMHIENKLLVEIMTKHDKIVYLSSKFIGQHPMACYYAFEKDNLSLWI